MYKIPECEMSMFEDAVILITGGTGTVGHFFLDSLLVSNCVFKEIRIFSRDEKKQFDMKQTISDKRVKYYIGDVKDISSVMVAMRGVDYVLHTAALKQVPSMEVFPFEAVKTNIIGTNNVILAAIEHNVKKFICVSTDKAVYPVNAMGMSKALMEKVLLSKAMEDGIATQIVCVRLGNVLGSRGSVLPVFVQGVLTGRGIIITGKNMTRFIMLAEEVVQLIVYAFNNATTGQIIVKKLDACSIQNLAEAVIDLFNASNSSMKIVDSRPGESEDESLLTEEEIKCTYLKNGYYIVSQEVTTGEINASQLNSATMESMSMAAIKEKLLKVDYILQMIKNR